MMNLIDAETCKKLNGKFDGEKCTISSQSFEKIKPGGKPKLNKIIVRTIDEPDADLSYLGEFSNIPKKGAIKHSEGGGKYKYFNPANPGYGQQDYGRMMEFQRGNIGMVGIQAEAEIYLPIGKKEYRIEQLTSGGIWGIETDSGREFMLDEAKNQINDLISHVKAFGIKTFDAPVEIKSDLL